MKLLKLFKHNDKTCVVHKYSFLVESVSPDIVVPGYLSILKIDTQDPRHITLWVLKDTHKDALSVRLKFAVFGTGHNIEPEQINGMEFLDTVFDGPFVWHVFGTADIL